jgi:uncharacterized protein with PQ loop repeat
MSDLNTVFIADVLGYIASLCFTLHYIPQTYHNWKRKNMFGFSALGVIIKLVGAAFLAVNSYFLLQPTSVVLYGFFNVAQHSFFIIQFALYPSKMEKLDDETTVNAEPGDVAPIPNTESNAVASNSNALEDRFRGNSSYLFWLLFPLVPLFFAFSFPASLDLTSYIKPLSQVLSQIPQLVECVKYRTTSAISFLSVHLGLIGGLCGLYMCYVFALPFSLWLIYVDAIVLQALSFYALAFWYKETIWTL